MGKQAVSANSCDSGSGDYNDDVEEVSEEEEPSSEEPVEEDPDEDEPQEVDSSEEPDEVTSGKNLNKSCDQEPDSSEEEPDEVTSGKNKNKSCDQEPDSSEEDPDEENSYEDEPEEDASCEEEPDEVNSCAGPNNKASNVEQNQESCEQEQCHKILTEEESEEEESDEEPNEEEPCEEEPDEVEPCEEPKEEPLEEDPCEEVPEEEEEEEPEEEEEEEPEEEEPVRKESDRELSEDLEKDHSEEEPIEEPPVSQSYNRFKKNTSQPNMSKRKSRSSNNVSCPIKSSEVCGTGNSSNKVSVNENLGTTGRTGKKRHSRWDSNDKDNELAEDGSMASKKRKTRWSRWSNDDSQFSMPSSIKDHDAQLDLEFPKLQANLCEIMKRLQSGVVDDRPESERSPSPPPIHNNLGIRINTREARLRHELMKQRQTIISELTRRNPNYKPPPDFKNSKFQKKLYIPLKEYPGYNFIGLIMGPCGNTHKKMEKETGAKILLRGNGSSHEGKLQSQNDYFNNEDLHVLIDARDQYSLDAATSMVEKLLIPVDDGHNVHKLKQLKELADLRGTLRDTSNSSKPDPCSVCGDSSHLTSACPLTAPTGNNSDGPTVNFFAEIGGRVSPFSAPPLLVSATAPAAKSKSHSNPAREIDYANLFVGYLPQSVDNNGLLELFCPFGTLDKVQVIKDKSTGLSKGYGFVKYTDSISAAKAIAQMNGYQINGKMLAVRVAGILPFPAQAITGSGRLLNQLSSYPGPPVTPQNYSGPGGLLGQPLSYPGPPVTVQNSTGPGGLLGRPPSYPGTLVLAQNSTGPAGLLGQFSGYPGTSVIVQSNPDPMHWPGPPESKLPESVASFSAGSTLLTHNSPFTELQPISLGLSSQVPMSTSLLSGNFVASEELAHFPGYLKSLDPRPQSNILSSSQLHFTKNFGI